MYVRWLIFITCVVIQLEGGETTESFKECFRKDSISCLQIQLYKAARTFMDRANVQLFSGVDLIKIEGNEGKSLEQTTKEEEIQKAKDVESRQKALETYLMTAGETFWKERTIIWNPAQTAKALVNTIPDTVTSQLTSFVLQARGKKKQLQMLVPLLIALKLKFITLASIAFMIIALIAKKAILAAAVSLVITGTTGLKSLLYSSKPVIHATEVMGYQAPTDWEPSTLGGGFSSYSQGDLFSSYSEPAPHHQLFIGHKGG